MPSPTPLRPSRTTPPIQQLRRSLKIRRSPANVLLTPLSTAFTPITPLTPLSTVFTYSHRGVGVCFGLLGPKPRSYSSTSELSASVSLWQSRFCPPFVFIFLRIAFSATPVFSQSSALPGGVTPNDPLAQQYREPKEDAALSRSGEEIIASREPRKSVLGRGSGR